MRRIVLGILAAGVALAALGYALFAATEDPTYAPLFFLGVVLAFAAVVALLLSRAIPPGEPYTWRTWAIAAGGAALVVVAAVTAFYASGDPMIMIAGLVLLFVYALVAGGVLARHHPSRQ